MKKIRVPLQSDFKLMLVLVGRAGEIIEPTSVDWELQFASGERLLQRYLVSSSQMGESWFPVEGSHFIGIPVPGEHRMEGGDLYCRFISSTTDAHFKSGWINNMGRWRPIFVVAEDLFQLTLVEQTAIGGRDIESLELDDGSTALSAVIPHVGVNDNWWVGEFDTGIHSIPRSESKIFPEKMLSRGDREIIIERLKEEFDGDQKMVLGGIEGIQTKLEELLEKGIVCGGSGENPGGAEGAIEKLYGQYGLDYLLGKEGYLSQIAQENHSATLSVKTLDTLSAHASSDSIRFVTPQMVDLDESTVKYDFRGMPSLELLPPLNVHEAEHEQSFSYIPNLRELDITLSGSLKEYKSFITNNAKLQWVSLRSGVDTAVFQSRGLCMNNPKLKRLDISGLKSATDLSLLAESCGELERVDFPEDCSGLTNLSGALSRTAIRELRIEQAPNLTDVMGLCVECGELEEVYIDPLAELLPVHQGELFSGCDKLKSVSQMSFATPLSGNSFKLLYNCPSLEDMGGLNGLIMGVDLSKSPNLTMESILNIQRSVGEADWALGIPTLYLHKNSYAQLTDEIKEQFMEKYWMVAERV